LHSSYIAKALELDADLVGNSPPPADGRIVKIDTVPGPEHLLDIVFAIRDDEPFDKSALRTFIGDLVRGMMTGLHDDPVQDDSCIAKEHFLIADPAADLERGFMPEKYAFGSRPLGNEGLS
jgi:hypothetical protein